MMNTLKNDIPLWIKASYTLLAIIIFPVYLYKYGAQNFLWFSDIAFFAMVPALWFKNRMIASMMAIGVLPIELLWIISLASGGAFFGIANYMFDPNLPLWLRLLSLFHFPMIVVIIYMIYNFGYDKRALFPQITLSLLVIAMTYAFSDHTKNINMIFLPKDIALYISNPIWFTLMPIVLVALFITPTYFLFKKLFPLKCNHDKKSL